MRQLEEMVEARKAAVGQVAKEGRDVPAGGRDIGSGCQRAGMQKTSIWRKRAIA